MPTPENQITVRLDNKDMEGFKRLRDHMQSTSPLRVRDGDLHRLVYHRGIEALKAEYALTIEPVPEPSTSSAE